jgi:hypothetical protein
LVAALAELTSALRVVPFKLVGGEQESEMKFFYVFNVNLYGISLLIP